MAREKDPEAIARAAEKKKLKEERKKLKTEQKNQKKEAKKKAKEISAQEAELSEDEEPGGIPVFLVTIIIVAIWLLILAVLIKMDVGGIGSGVLAPILKNVPVVNQILPNETTITPDGTGDTAYSGYTSLSDAVDQIKRLEQELETAQQKNLADEDQLSTLKAEVERLKTFEDKQTEFERIKTAFYEEVVYAENGPGADEYRKYYEEMDPATAEYLYQQVVQEQQVNKEISDYASAYAAMKPKEAAAIFDTMTDDLSLVSKILGAMGTDDRGKILAQMNQDTAARVTKMMDPGN